MPLPHPQELLALAGLIAYLLAQVGSRWCRPFARRAAVLRSPVASRLPDDRSGLVVPAPDPAGGASSLSGCSRSSRPILLVAFRCADLCSRTWTVHPFDASTRRAPRGPVAPATLRKASVRLAVCGNVAKESPSETRALSLS
jgi:hypothetical protein